MVGSLGSAPVVSDAATRIALCRKPRRKLCRHATLFSRQDAKGPKREGWAGGYRVSVVEAAIVLVIVLVLVLQSRKVCPTDSTVRQAHRWQGSPRQAGDSKTPPIYLGRFSANEKVQVEWDRNTVRRSVVGGQIRFC